MKKGIAVILLSLTLVVCISFVVLADSVATNITGSQPVSDSKYAAQSPVDLNRHQILAKSNNQKDNAPSKTVNGSHSSKLANFKKLFHNKIVGPIRSG